ncbi:MAG: VWA domain-containing protein, partial [Planctomycetes bacterium]|nr:VWA domain-containing protein [Planctomycetota bacterium]
VVPSTRLWREAIEEPVANRFLSPIKRWSELLLQMLALLLLVLAMAGLRIPDLGGPPQRRVFVLDARASMHAQDGPRSRLQMAKEIMQQAAERAGPADTFGLITIAARHTIVVEAGSSASELLAALERLEVPLAPCSDDDYAIALGEAAKVIAAGETPELLTGPLKKGERVPSLFGVRTLGKAVENRGLTSLYLEDTREGGLAISAGVYQFDQTPVAVALEMESSGQWTMLDSAYANAGAVRFELEPELVARPLRGRLRLSQGDAFASDDQINFRWQVPPNLRGLPDHPAIASFADAMRFPLANEVQAQGRIELVASDLDKVHGVVLRSPGSAFSDVPAEPITLSSISPLLAQATDIPLLFIANQPVALTRTRGQMRDLILAEALLEDVPFTQSNEFFAIVGDWYRNRRFAALPEDARGVEGEAVMDQTLSERVGYERNLIREAR